LRHVDVRLVRCVFRQSHAGELLALDWRNVGADLGTVRIACSVKADGSIGGTKGDRERVVPLDSHLLEVLRAHRRESSVIGGLVFRSQARERLTHHALRRGHRAALNAAGWAESGYMT
jgi:integrase